MKEGDGGQRLFIGGQRNSAGDHSESNQIGEFLGSTKE